MPRQVYFENDFNKELFSDPENAKLRDTRNWKLRKTGDDEYTPVVEKGSVWVEPVNARQPSAFTLAGVRYTRAGTGADWVAQAQAVTQ